MAKNQFVCEECKRQLQVDEDETGQEVRCPHCEHVMHVPDEPASGQEQDAVTGAGAGVDGEPAGAGPADVKDEFESPESTGADVPGTGDAGASRTGSKFSVTGVLETSFSIFFEDFVSFISLGLIVLSPLLLVTLILVLSPMEAGELQITWQVTNLGTSLVLLPLLAGAMMYGVIRRLNGEGFVVTECLSDAFALLFPLIGVSLLQGLIILVGGVFCLIPGLVALTMLYVSTPALVIEKTGVIDALGRSYNLTSGHLLRIFGIILVLFLLNLVLVLPVQFSTVGFVPAGATVSSMKLFICGSTLMALITNTIASITVATTYYFLRMDEEDTTIDELVHLFD